MEENENQRAGLRPTPPTDEQLAALEKLTTGPWNPYVAGSASAAFAIAGPQLLGEVRRLRAALERNQEAMRLALGTLAPILARFEKRCATGLSGPLDAGESGEGHTPTEHKHLRALRQEIQRMQAAHDEALIVRAEPARPK